MSMDYCQEFLKLGTQISNKLTERQFLHRRADKIQKEIKEMRNPGMSLAEMRAFADGEIEDIINKEALDFLESDNPWEPKVVKERVEAFNKFLQDNKSQFKRVPIGPLHQHVRVKGADWSGLMEKILFNYLHTYIAHNREDYLKMLDVISEFNNQFQSVDEYDDPLYPIGVIIMDYDTVFIQSYRHRTFAASLKFPCVNVSEMITFKAGDESADLWRAFISDNLNGQSTFLFENEHDAFVCMHGVNNLDVKNRKFDVLLGFSLDGFEIHPFPEFRTRSIKVPKKASFLGIDLGPELYTLITTKAEIENDIKIHDQAIQTLRRKQWTALSHIQDIGFNKDESVIAVQIGAFFTSTPDNTI